MTEADYDATLKDLECPFCGSSMGPYYELKRAPSLFDAEATLDGKPVETEDRVCGKCRMPVRFVKRIG